MKVRRAKAISANISSPPGSPSDSSDSNELLKSIETGALRINQLASGLSEQVVAFEEWLNRLPGKVRASVWETLDDHPSGMSVHGLSLRRHGKKWILAHCFSYLDTPTEEEVWEPVTEANIEVKLFVIRNSQKLLTSIADQQKRMAEDIVKAQAEFDSFAATIGLALQKKEG